MILNDPLYVILVSQLGPPFVIRCYDNNNAPTTMNVIILMSVVKAVDVQAVSINTLPVSYLSKEWAIIIAIMFVGFIGYYKKVI